MKTKIDSIKSEVRKPKKIKLIIILVIILALAAGGIYYFKLKREQEAIMALASISQLEELKKTDLEETISLSGVVYSDDTKNVYTSLSYQVEEVLVEVGDKVKKGQVLVQLDTTNLLMDIETAENSLKNSRDSLESEYTSRANSITNAENSLKSAELSLERQKLQYEKALDDLKDAEEDMADPFDSYNYDNAVKNAKIALQRKADDLKDAKEDLEEAEDDFDDYSYQNAITEAKVNLEKRKDDLKKAEEKLVEETNEFDDFTYQNAIKDAATAHARAQSQLAQANGTQLSGGSNSDAIVAAERAVEDARKNYDIAVENLQRAKDKALEAAEDAVKDAKTAVQDAERAYNRAQTDLPRAKDDAVENAENAVKNAQRAYDDAKETYDKAVSDRKKAEEDAIENVEKALKTAQRNVTDGKKSLESAELSVENAKESLRQAKEKELPSETNIRNQEISLKKLYENLEKSTIKSTVDGTVTEVNAVEGNAASGILLSIENDGVLYVSANVMEYNLDSISIGQRAKITTVATDDKVFEGEISYISPKAVSAAGSTSVEFEIRAEFLQPTDEVKIGMNAFIDVVTAEAKDVFAISTTALIERGRDSFIYCDINDVVTEIPVKTGVRTNSQVQIISDELREGLRIIGSTMGINPGDSVSELQSNNELKMKAMEEQGDRASSMMGPGGGGGMTARSGSGGGRSGNTTRAVRMG